MEQTMEQNIELNLSFQEVNLILRTLAKQPFDEVYELMGSIKQQGDKQVIEQQETEPMIEVSE